MFHPGGSRTPWGTPPHASHASTFESAMVFASASGRALVNLSAQTGASASDDRPLRLLFCHLVGGAAKQTSSPQLKFSTKIVATALTALHPAADASAFLLEGIEAYLHGVFLSPDRFSERGHEHPYGYPVQHE